MNGIQIVLLTGTLLLAIYFIIRIKKRVIDIIFMSVVIACATLCILWPDATNVIAHRLGVGRGTDLIFYLSVLLFWFVVLKLYIRIRRLEQVFTDIIRKDAIEKADNFSSKDNVNNPLDSREKL
jgi:hypothetical protein